MLRLEGHSVDVIFWLSRLFIWLQVPRVAVLSMVGQGAKMSILYVLLCCKRLLQFVVSGESPCCGHRVTEWERSCRRVQKQEPGTLFEFLASSVSCGLVYWSNPNLEIERDDWALRPSCLWNSLPLWTQLCFFHPPQCARGDHGSTRGPKGAGGALVWWWHQTLLQVLSLKCKCWLHISWYH